MGKIAKIRDGGFFKKGLVIVTNIKKNGEEGESKAYTVKGHVGIERAGDKYILHFMSVSGSSMGATSRGTFSGRSYTRNHDIVVDRIESIEEE
jgi:hypothetical protein